MFTGKLAVLAALAAAASASLSGVSSAEPAPPTTVVADGSAACAETMYRAVIEDNSAYDARSYPRYKAILNPRVMFNNAGSIIQGRPAILDGARAAWAVPGWHWTYQVLSETLFNCTSGIAVVDAHTVYPDLDKHWSVTMMMAFKNGKWTVAMDTVNLISATKT
ncbi:MAG: hypothetical protein ACR2JQ_08510 [Mycobacteriales bacterium]